MSKGFVISDEDLELFKEWVTKPGSVETILKEHSKKMESINSYFDKIEQMQILSHKFLTTPFIPLL